jgi:RNA polymerase sigma-70 factor (ECF subfamily)
MHRSAAGDPEGTPREADSADEARRRRFFQSEVERLMDRLYGTGVRLTRNAADAEDLVAEALTTAWSRLDTLQDLQAFEKWVFRILTNTFVSRQRRRRETPATELEQEEEEGDPASLFDRLHQPFLLWWDDAEQRLLDRLACRDVERALDGLPDPFRLVVVLVAVEGFTYAEAAETLSIPVGTVRSRLSRGRSLLQDAFWRHARRHDSTAERRLDS